MTDNFNILDQPSSGGGGEDYILIVDQKTSGTAGGTFTSGSWQTRDLNTIISDTGSHASVALNQITLAAGTYRFKAFCPALAVFDHAARLQNITDAVTIQEGMSHFSFAVDVINPGIIAGKFVIAASKIIEVQHQCSGTDLTFGFGVNVDFTTVEQYTMIEFFKET